MKKVFYILIFIFLQINLEAQIINKLSVELNIGRFAKETGLLDSDYYSNDITYINGFNIGYNPSAKWQYYFGIRKLSSVINYGWGFSSEYSEIRGAEVKIGVKLSPSSHKKVFFSYGLEIFEEVSNQKGTYWVDYPPTYEINHRKNYFGIAPNLTINLKLVDRIIIFVDSRFRFGRVNLEQIESTQPNKELYPSRGYWLPIYEPINSLGIRLKL